MYLERDFDDERALLATTLADTEELYQVLELTDANPRIVDKLASIKGRLEQLVLMLDRSNTWLVLRERETGETRIEYFSDGDYFIFHKVTKLYAFDDIDDTYIIDEIVFDGRKCYYCGWEPGMRFVYRYEDTDEIAFEGEYPQYDH
jgi:hypothetical protein